MPLLRRSTLVILGYGSIGQTVARSGKHFGMRVIGIKRTAGESDGVADEMYCTEDLHLVLPRADFLVLSLPSHPSTVNIMSTAEFSLMKKTAVIINAGRGNSVDENALIIALETGIIGGAALDVFKVEPLPEYSPLWTVPNLVISPHISWYGEDAYEIYGERLEIALKQFLDGSEFSSLVDLNKGY